MAADAKARAVAVAELKHIVVVVRWLGVNLEGRRDGGRERCGRSYRWLPIGRRVALQVEQPFDGIENLVAAAAPNPAL